jgi:transposase
LNALFYILKTGCQWRMRPNDFGQWSKEGLIQKIHKDLRDLARKKEGKENQIGSYY